CLFSREAEVRRRGRSRRCRLMGIRRRAWDRGIAANPRRAVPGPQGSSGYINKINFCDRGPFVNRYFSGLWERFVGRDTPALAGAAYRGAQAGTVCTRTGPLDRAITGGAFHLLRSAVAVLMLIGIGNAQTVNGVIDGTVVDATTVSTPIPGAAITV